MCDSSFNSNHGDLIYISIVQIFSLKEYFPQQFWPVNFSRNSLIGTVLPPIPLCNGRNLQYLHQHFSATYFLVRLHFTYFLYSFIVQLYRTYYLYYIVLRISLDLCAAYLDYSATFTQTLCPCSSNGLFLAARLIRGSIIKNVQWGA